MSNEDQNGPQTDRVDRRDPPESSERAPHLIGVADDAADAERLREYARIGYAHMLESELDEARLLTYRAWADAPEMGAVARTASRRAASR